MFNQEVAITSLESFVGQEVTFFSFKSAVPVSYGVRLLSITVIISINYFNVFYLVCHSVDIKRCYSYIFVSMSQTC